MLGLLLLLQGMSSITQGIALREVSPFWGVTLFSGILMTGLGLWVSTSDGVWTLAARSAFILLWVGCMAVFRGVQDVTIGFTLRHSSKQEDQPARRPGTIDRPQRRRSGTPPARPQTPVQPVS